MVSSSYSETKRLQELNVENTKKAEELEEKIEQAEKQYRDKIVKAEDEVKRLKEKAREEMDRLKEGMLAKAKEERQRLIDQALNVKERLRDEIEGELVEKSLELSRRIITDVLSAQSQQLLFEGFIDEVLGDLRNMDKEALEGIDPETEVVQVRTSHEMSDARRQRFAQVLSSKIGGDIPVRQEIDKEIIVGVIIQIGSLVIDGSLIAKFKKAAEGIRQES